MKEIDIFVQNYVSLSRTQSETEFFYLITNFFDFSIQFVLVIIAFSVLIYLRVGPKKSGLFLGSIVLGAILVKIIKTISNIPRPSDNLVSDGSMSFPSYHATISTIFFLMLMFTFKERLGKLQRILFNFSCVVFILLIGFSRIYLGAHWLSDVLGGIALGFIVSFTAVFLSKRL